MVVGGGIFAYGITNVVALFQQLYVEEAQHRLLMDQVNSFMHSRALPRKLRDEIRANFFHMRKAARASKLLDDAIFRQMSRTLQANVATIFCQEVMPRAFPFLAGCNAEFIHELYLCMTVRCFLPGEDIIRQGEYGSEMYFLSVGHVQVFLNHTKVAALGPTAFFGEFGIFNPTKPRLATIQAMEFSETHCVERRDVFRILVSHPFVLRSIQSLATLRSRKALAIMYESGGKSRTLLQGLASMWHQEGGILGMLPRGMGTEHLPALQEYLPPEPPVSAAAMRRASVRATLSSSFTGADASGTLSTGGRRRSIAPSFSSDLAMASSARTARSARHSTGWAVDAPGASSESVRSLSLRPESPSPLSTVPGSTATTSDQTPQVRSSRRRMSIDSTDKARMAATVATLGKRLSESDRLGESGQRTQPATASPPPADARIDELLTQLHDIAKRQELLDDQMQDILRHLEAEPPHELDRFREQHQLSVAVPPIGRLRSQYFHRGVGIPEGRESTLDH